MASAKLLGDGSKTTSLFDCRHFRRLYPSFFLGKQSIQKDIAFHLYGQLDFILAVGAGLTFTVLQVPLMENIAPFPIVLIPLFGVSLTGASSIMAIDALIKQRPLASR